MFVELACFVCLGAVPAPQDPRPVLADTADLAVCDGRLVATGQLWRGRSLALWLEGGAAAWRLVSAAGVATRAVRPTGGLTLHWREGDWGAALHYGNAIDVSVLSAFAAWQGWRRLGLLAGWHSFEGRSGFGLGASLRF